jgi:signal transduction histidine kinase
VLASSANLLRLINQILDLSRIEAGKMDLHPESVDLSLLVSAVIKEAEAMGRDRPYRVQLDCPRDLRVDTDPAKLQQILTNLVANAIKFTSQGSVTVEVKAEEPNEVTISVVDTGIGIRPEHLEIIFEEFRQVDGSSTRRFGGTGLGLAIARRLTEMLDGKLEVKSTYGVGSTFTLRIPRQIRTPRPTPRRAVDMDSNPSIDAPQRLQGVRE